MTDLIERSLLTALANMISARPESPQKVFVVYDSDIPKLVKDIRAGLAGETPREVVVEDYHPGGCMTMSKQMIERVAREIYGVSPFSAAPSDNPGDRTFLRWYDLETRHRDQFRDEARAAIAAMREPTFDPDTVSYHQGMTRADWWKAMIDESLK
jgi:hypothetical protein